MLAIKTRFSQNSILFRMFWWPWPYLLATSARNSIFSRQADDSVWRYFALSSRVLTGSPAAVPSTRMTSLSGPGWGSLTIRPHEAETSARLASHQESVTHGAVCVASPYGAGRGGRRCEQQHGAHAHPCTLRGWGGGRGGKGLAGGRAMVTTVTRRPKGWAQGVVDPRGGRPGYHEYHLKRLYRGYSLYSSFISGCH